MLWCVYRYSYNNIGFMFGSDTEVALITTSAMRVAAVTPLTDNVEPVSVIAKSPIVSAPTRLCLCF